MTWHPWRDWLIRRHYARMDPAVKDSATEAVIGRHMLAGALRVNSDETMALLAAIDAAKSNGNFNQIKSMFRQAMFYANQLGWIITVEDGKWVVTEPDPDPRIIGHYVGTYESIDALVDGLHEHVLKLA